MKKLPLYSIIYSICIASVVFGCQREKEEGFDKDKVDKEVRDMFTAYHQAIEKEGFLGELPFLDDTEDFFWVPPGFTTALSIDSVKTILQTNSELYNETSFYWEMLKIYPISNKMASYSGIVKGSMLDTAKTRIDIAIIESGTVIKREDGWKLLSGQSANLP